MAYIWYATAVAFMIKKKPKRISNITTKHEPYFRIAFIYSSFVTNLLTFLSFFSKMMRIFCLFVCSAVVFVDALSSIRIGKLIRAIMLYKLNFQLN